LKSIVAAHSKNLFVDRRVWERFLEVMQELRQQGEVHDEDLANLLYRDYVSTVLIDVEASDVAKVNKQFILQEVAKAWEARERERALDLETLKEEQAERLRAFAEGMEATWKAKIEKGLADIEERCRRRASLVAVLLCALCTGAYIVVVALLFLLVLSEPFKPWVSAVALAAAFLAPSSIVAALWRFLRPWMRRNLARRLYARNSERVRLEGFLGSPGGSPSDCQLQL